MKTFAAPKDLTDPIETLILMALELTNCVIVVPRSIRGDRMPARFPEDLRPSVYGSHLLRASFAQTMRQIDVIIAVRSKETGIPFVPIVGGRSINGPTNARARRKRERVWSLQKVAIIKRTSNEINIFRVSFAYASWERGLMNARNNEWRVYSWKRLCESSRAFGESITVLNWK